MACSICLDTVTARGVIDACDHLFCYDCIIKWGTSAANTCPVCKRQFHRVVEATIEPAADGDDPMRSPARKRQRETGRAVEVVDRAQRCDDDEGLMMEGEEDDEWGRLNDLPSEDEEDDDYQTHDDEDEEDEDEYPNVEDEAYQMDNGDDDLDYLLSPDAQRLARARARAAARRGTPDVVIIPAGRASPARRAERRALRRLRAAARAFDATAESAVSVDEHETLLIDLSRASDIDVGMAPRVENAARRRRARAAAAAAPHSPPAVAERVDDDITFIRQVSEPEIADPGMLQVALDALSSDGQFTAAAARQRRARRRRARQEAGLR